MRWKINRVRPYGLYLIGDGGFTLRLDAEVCTSLDSEIIKLGAGVRKSDGFCSSINPKMTRLSFDKGILKLAHLTDMEELLGRIENCAIRDYMHEAMSCYMASAYRGCIVLSYIALFDDLLLKLGELAKVNALANSIFIQAKKKKEDQDVYESFLIDQLASKSLLSGLDSSFLSTLREIRNKSAHPSGHRPSAEEARFIFHEVVSRFLSRPILSTTQLAEEIVVRLSNSNFFPSSIANEIKGVVAEEIKTLHQEAIPVLVAKLAQAATSTDTTLSNNGRKFFIGLCCLDNGNIDKELQKKIIETKSDDPRFSKVILSMLSANGKLFSGLSPITCERIRGVISKEIDQLKLELPESKLMHPAQTIRSLAKHLDSASLLTHFGSELSKLFEKKTFSRLLITTFATRPEVVSLYFPVILSKAGDSDFYTANSSANSIEEMDSEFAAFCSEEYAFQLLVGVLRAAAFGAYASQELRDSKFCRVPKLRSKASVYIKENEPAAMSYLESKIGGTETESSFISKYFTAKPIVEEA